MSKGTTGPEEGPSAVYRLASTKSKLAGPVLARVVACEHVLWRRVGPTLKPRWWPEVGPKVRRSYWTLTAAANGLARLGHVEARPLLAEMRAYYFSLPPPDGRGQLGDALDAALRELQPGGR